MKIVLIVVSCLVVLAGIGIGGMIWMSERKLDVSDPKTAANFKTGFVPSCLRSIDERANAAGKTLTDAENAQYTQLCGCMADETLAKLSQNGGMSVADMMHPERLAGQMQQSIKVCTTRLGLSGS